MPFPPRFSLNSAARLCAIAGLVFAAPSPGFGQEKSIFNGTDLSGWAQVGNSWSVKDGAITCAPADDTSMLVWKGGEVSDFQFTAKFRWVTGFDKKWWWSGVRFRNHIVNPDRLDMVGACYDMTLNFGRTGNLFEQGGRGIFSYRGTRSFLVNSGDILHPYALYSTAAFPDVEKVRTTYKQEEWNELKIVAVGRHTLGFLNGTQIDDGVDETSAPILSGALALVKGPVQFKDLTFRDLKGINVLPPFSGLPAEVPPKWSAVRIHYLKAGSATLKPKGTKIDRNPVMDTDDPEGVAEGKPIYFDLRTGREVHYEVNADVPLTELSYTGAGFFNFHLEVRDAQGTVLKDCGLNDMGSSSGIIRLPLPNLMRFEVVLKSSGQDWLLAEDLHFASAPAASIRPLASTATATPIPRYAAAAVAPATPVPPPPPVVVAALPPPSTPRKSSAPAAPGSPMEKHSQTPMAGGQSGKDFAETQPDGGSLVGLDIWKGEYYRALVIGGIRAVYKTDGGRVRGQIFGRGNGDPDITLQADDRESPVVEVETTDDKEQIIALRVRFRNGQETPWFGRETPRNLPLNKMPRNLRTTRLNAGGWRGALGIYGGADGMLFRLGLIY